MIKFIQKILGIVTKDRVDNICVVVGALIHDVKTLREDVDRLKTVTTGNKESNN